MPEENEYIHCILLAAFNGEHFIAGQLASIRSQSSRRWLLLVRDDGSSDGTLSVIMDAARRDCRIRLVSDRLGHLGIAGNFSRLLQEGLATGAAYFHFCDQDDYWEPTRLELFETVVRRHEEHSGRHEPVLVHSDLAVAGKELEVIDHSLVDRLGLRQAMPGRLDNLLLRNCVTGCASMMNRPLAELVAPIPSEAMMHDWWAALLAACCGSLVFIPECTVLYRFHGSNAVGAATSREKLSVRLFSPLGLARSLAGEFRSITTQAAALGRRIRQRDCSCDESRVELVERFSSSRLFGFGDFHVLAREISAPLAFYLKYLCWRLFAVGDRT